MKPGDRVLVKILAHQGKHKIENKWEDRPYIIIKQPNEEIPVYSLQREDKSGKIRTLHRNVLLPIDSLLDKADDKSSQAKSLPKTTPRKLKPKPQPRKRTMQKKRINKEEESYHKPADASDSDDSITYVKQVYEENRKKALSCLVKIGQLKCKTRRTLRP